MWGRVWGLGGWRRARALDRVPPCILTSGRCLGLSWGAEHRAPHLSPSVVPAASSFLFPRFQAPEGYGLEAATAWQWQIGWGFWKEPLGELSMKVQLSSSGPEALQTLQLWTSKHSLFAQGVLCLTERSVHLCPPRWLSARPLLTRASARMLGELRCCQLRVLSLERWSPPVGQCSGHRSQPRAWECLGAPLLARHCRPLQALSVGQSLPRSVEVASTLWTQRDWKENAVDTQNARTTQGPPCENVCGFTLCWAVRQVWTLSRNVSPTGGHQGGRQESISQPGDLVGRRWGWRGFCVGAWLSQRWSCSAPPPRGSTFSFLMELVTWLARQKIWETWNLPPSQFSYPWIMLPSTSLKQELKLFLRRVGLLRSSLSQLRCAATHGSLTAASPLTDACGSSRLAFFHLLILPRTPTVPGPSCSVRPPAFPALKHIHVPRGVPSHCHCASLSRVQHPVARSVVSDSLRPHGL